MQSTLMLIKPDGIEKNLEGPIKRMIEDAGLVVTHEKEIHPTRSHFEAHYAFDDEWKRNVGEGNLSLCEKMNIDPNEAFGTNDPIEIGDVIRDRLIEYMLSRPIKAFVIQGEDAIQRVRNLSGSTVPARAEPDTIRGRFGSDANEQPILEKRSIQNIVHTSGNFEEADFELKHWFSGKAN